MIFSKRKDIAQNNCEMMNMELGTDNNRRKLGIRLEPISSLPHYNPYSLNLHRCETGDSIRPLNSKEIS